MSFKFGTLHIISQKLLTQSRSNSGSEILRSVRRCVTEVTEARERQEANCCQLQGAAEVVKHFKILVTCFSARVSQSADV